jgi:large repetitive protein
LSEVLFYWPFSRGKVEINIVRKRRLSSIIALLLLLFQLFSPIGSVFAAEGGVLLPPSNLAYQPTTPDDGKLVWSSVYGATGYNVYKIVDGQIVLLGTTKTNTYSLNNQEEGNYSYIVSTLSTDGESGPCAPVDVSITYPIMTVPTTITSSIQNGNDIVLNWRASQYAEKYNVYELQSDGEKKLLATTISPTYKVVNTNEGMHSYLVSAVHSLYGESTPTAPIDVTIVFPVMNDPENLTFTITNATDINLKWQAVSYANSYKIYQVIDNQEVLKTTVTTTSAKFTNMPEGDYVYKLYSYSDRFGQSEAGTTVSLSVSSVVMTPPDNALTTIKNQNDIVLSWNTAPNADSYKVYQIINGERVLKNTVTGTTVTFGNMPEGDYTYQVYSYNNRFGESSDGANLSLSIVFPNMVPPTNVLNEITSPTSFKLSWDATDYATSYKVYQVINGSKTLKSTVSGTSITYSSMLSGEYQYEIHTYSSRFGESKDGTQVAVTLTGQAMGTPSNLVYAISNGNDIKLTWNPVHYATNYKIYKVIAGFKILQNTITGTSITYTNQAEGDYDYVVHSYYSLLGESPEGAEAQFTLVYPSMEKPQNLTGSIQNISDVILKWDSVPFATGYNIFEIINDQEVLKKTVTTTSTTFSKVSEGTHSYVVRSNSSRFGESQDSSTVGLTVSFPELLAPTNLTNTIVNGNDITLKWNTATYATSYNIYQVIDGIKIFKKSVTGTSVTFSNMPEGNYSYEVYTQSDRFGESISGNDISLSLTFPEMQAPADLTKNILNGNDISLSWKAASYANVYKVYQVVDGSKILLKTVTSTSAYLSNMPEGDYQLEVYSFSDRFNESANGSPISFGLVYPTMQAPGNTTYSIVNGNDISLRWNTAAYATAYNIYQVVDGNKTLIKTVTGTSAILSNMPEGDYGYEVYSYSNRFGESPIGSFVSFNLIWPVVQPPVMQGSIFNANNVTLTWNSVQWANEYRLYEIKGYTKTLLYKGSALTYKIYNLTEEMHSYQAVAYSTRFGESELSNLLVEDIIYPEMQPPVANIKVTSPTSAQISWNFVTYANGYNVYEMVDGKPVLLVKNLNNLSYTVSNLSYKNHEFYVTSYSNSFGESSPSDTVLAKLITDTLPPETKADYLPNWTNSSQTISLTVTDNDSGVAKTYYSLNDSPFVEGTTVSIENEGMNKVSFYSVDKVGNTEAVQTIYSKIDKTYPATSLEQEPKGYTQTYTGKLVPTDSDSGIAKTYYSINGSEYVEGSIFVVNQEGINHVSYFSMDQAGNVEGVKAVDVKIDQTAPKTTSDSPISWSKNDVLINLIADDSESGVAKTYYSINGSEYLEGTSLMVDQEGVNQVSFYSVDNAGNKEEAKTIEVKLDKTAPKTTSDAPASWINNEIQVNLVAADSQSGVAKTYYSINGSDYVEGAAFTVNQEGVNEVSFYSIDKAGNKEPAQKMEVKIDKTAPMITTDIDEYYNLGSPLNLNYQTMDLLSGVEKESVILTSPNQPIGEVVNKLSQITLDQPGEYTLTIFATDIAGNTQVVKKQFTVYIPATIRVTPNVIKGNKGVFIVRVEIPTDLVGNQLDLHTAQLNGIKALNSNNGYYNQAKLGQFKFERSDFPWTTGEQTLEFRCYLNGYLVIGQTVVKVIN